MLVECRSYLPVDLSEDVTKRTEELNISKSEYLRTLATLDISIQMYQKLCNYLNYLYNNINNIQNQLGMFSTPLEPFQVNIEN